MVHSDVTKWVTPPLHHQPSVIVESLYKSTLESGMGTLANIIHSLLIYSFQNKDLANI